MRIMKLNIYKKKLIKYQKKAFAQKAIKRFGVMPIWRRNPMKTEIATLKFERNKKTPRRKKEKLDIENVENMTDKELRKLERKQGWKRAN